MEDEILKIAQEDINEALKTVESIEQIITKDPQPRENIKEKFNDLSARVKRLENLLKEEGIL